MDCEASKKLLIVTFFTFADRRNKKKNMKIKAHPISLASKQSKTK